MIDNTDLLINVSLMVNILIIILGTKCLVDRNPGFLSEYLSTFSILCLNICLFGSIMWLSILHFPISLLAIAIGIGWAVYARRKRGQSNNSFTYTGNISKGLK
jgi:hypothetical protein